MPVVPSPVSRSWRPATSSRLRSLVRPALVAASCLGLSACTAHMDMTISSQGSYDVALEMRDTTGTVFPQGKTPDCSAYSDPTALGVPAGTTVKAEPLTGDDDPGCQVSISGVKVPQASAAEPNTIVVRDGDVYKVTIQPFSSDPQGSGGTDDAGAAGAVPQATADPSGGQGEPQPSSTSFKGVVDTKVSVTFPGAVTQSGGGKVSGTTVTWDDPDTVAKGVSASGYAQDSRGVSWWSRSSVWITAGLVLLGGVLAAAVARRRTAGRLTRRRRTREKQEKSAE
ncbi:translation initiation factor 2 [Actinomyces viscosus]|uniref:translation initiation factor 2 n=1 Tax=Actinomyces viscosus TaxID=1656 RepID=UPI0028E339A1|nr:translation initiation factor 2 [Actinomyces viscosus]